MHSRQDSLDGGSARRKAATYTQNKLPRVGFEDTIPVFERAKMVHALGRAATVIGQEQGTRNQIQTLIKTYGDEGCTHGRAMKDTLTHLWS
jgi:hypothetical protein